MSRTLCFTEEYFRDKGIAEGFSKGGAKGLKRGEHTTKVKIAERLRSMGMNDEDIHRATELSLEDIRSLELVEA